MNNHPSLYAAFDLYPSAKGSATHIYYMTQTLFNFFGGGMLVVLGNEKMPQYQEEGSVEIFRFNEPIENYLKRAEAFSHRLSDLISEQSNLQLCHFRDLWGGLAILQKERTYKTVFEVNALFSIELPYKYSDIHPSTLEKIKAIEQFCMEETDVIITPSQTIKKI